MQEQFEKDIELDYGKIYQIIKKRVKSYLIDNKIKSCVIGISGGLDSGINTVLVGEICKELNIPFIGRYIHIETNKEEEMLRANAIGELYCTDYKSIDLTEGYKGLLPFIEEKEVDPNNIETRFNRGNIKCRLRMIYLYNLARENKGLIIDNDNLTEHLLGFWTINGDVFDLTPLASLFKTECFELAKWMRDNVTTTEEGKVAMQALIDAVPTDGLGITASDTDQFGCGYDVVDDILKNANYRGGNDYYELYNKYDETVVDSIIRRNENSAFKRKHPTKIKIDIKYDDVVSDEKTLFVREYLRVKNLCKNESWWFEINDLAKDGNKETFNEFVKEKNIDVINAGYIFAFYRA